MKKHAIILAGLMASGCLVAMQMQNPYDIMNDMVVEGNSALKVLENLQKALDPDKKEAAFNELIAQKKRHLEENRLLCDELKNKKEVSVEKGLAIHEILRKQAEEDIQFRNKINS